MKASLQKLCEDFIANRDEAAKAFKWDMNYVYPICANIFCSHGRMTSEEQLKQSRKVIDGSVGVLSNFRGNIRPVLAAMLAAGGCALTGDRVHESEEPRWNVVRELRLPSCPSYLSGITYAGGNSYYSVADNGAAVWGLYPCTIQLSADGKTVILYLWYDNEFGYSNQVIRLARHIGEVKSYRYY